MAGTSARRVVVGAVRVAALFAIIVGVSGIFVPALTREPGFYGVTFAFAVMSFFLLSPRRRPVAAAVPAAPVEPVYIVDEAKIAAAREEEKERWANELAKSVDAARRVKQSLATSEDAHAAQSQQIEELTRTVLSLREQINAQQEASKQQIAHFNAELEKRAGEIESRKGDHDQEIQIRDRKIAESQRALETERGIREQVASLARELQQQVTQTAAAQGDMKRAVDQERAARERAEARIAELDRALESHSKDLEAERAAREQVAAIASEHEREVVKAREQMALLIDERESAHAEIRSMAARLNELQDALDAERTQAYDKITSARNEIQALTARIAEVQHAFEDERWQWSAVREDLSNRIADLQKLLEHEREESNERLSTETAEKSALAARLGQLQEAIERERQEWDTKLQTIVAGLAADHENDLGKAIEERESARAELRGATARASDLQQAIERERKEFDEKLQRITSGMAAGHENDIGRAIEEREAARAEVRGGAAKIGDLQQTLDRERHEFDEKLQKIVAEMAADHENDLGEAMTQREAARAEARYLSGRVQEMQRQIEELRSRTVDESALRQKLDTEWSEKLQTIVTHLASDHDADIGKAVEEKEEAKAEARTLASKVASLEKQLERDRQVFAMAESKWNSLRDGMKKEIETLKSAAAPAPPAEPFSAPVSIPTPEPFPALLPSEIEQQQRARAEVLEVAEQAHAVLKRTAPGTVPIPRDERRPLILFVHHDPNMRTMWRDQLHKHGYDVITAVDGLEGLRMATSQHPTVVIADVQMPKMDGRELCRLLKTNDATSSMKVILMSGVYGEEPSGDHQKADEVLRKPVKFDALQTAITNVVAGQGAGSREQR